MVLFLKRLSLVLLIPLGFLVLLETALRVAGSGVTSRLYLVDEWNGRNLATENPHFTRKYFGRRLERAPWPAAFPVPKPVGEFRVFLLGESAALGDPIPEFGMARILEVLLQEAKPEKRVRVINSAITAINSHVIREIADEAARLEPDAVVIYMGNNEVVGPFGPGTVFTAVAKNPAVIQCMIALRGTRTGQLLEDMLAGWRKRPGQWAGMEMFLERAVEAGDPRLGDTRRLFAQNLEAIIDCFDLQRVPVVLSTVAVNLRDCSPLGAAETNHPAVRAYLAGRQAEHAGDFPGALALYREAMERDPLRFRADAAINTMIHEAAARMPVRFVDGEAVISEASSNGIPDEAMFYDHVHLTFDGQYLLARQFAAALSGANDFPSVSAVAGRIGWNAFGERETLHEMFARRLRPPFAGQVDRETVQQRWVDKLIHSELALRNTNPSSGGRMLEVALDARGDRDAEIWKLKAAYDMDHGSPGSAAKAYAQAAALWPHQSELIMDEAAALAAGGKTEKAFRLLRDDSRWDQLPDDAIWSAMGERLVKLGWLEHAQSLFHQAWLLNTDNPEVLVNLGASKATVGQKAEAVAMLSRAVVVKPEDDVAWANLGRALVESGDTEEGLAAMEKAMNLNPQNAMTLSSLGVMYYRQKRYADARRCLDAALVEDPLDIATLADAVLLAIADERFGDAAELQARIARLQPVDASAQYRAGQLWMKNDQPSRAVPYLQRALELAPETTAWRRNLAWLLATHPDDSVRDPVHAQRLAESLAETGDEAWMNLDVRAAIHAANGRMDEAFALTERIQPDQVPAEFRTRIRQRTTAYREGRPYIGSRTEYIPE